MLTLGVFVILAGQVQREPLAPDDLREVEIAREMYLGGDYVIPHLAGKPFVEKPSGFSAAVAAAYHAAGGPSVVAARAVSVFFALMSLAAVFLLGRCVLGSEGGALAALLLALSARFCRTAHEVLLDNALVASLACALLFAWFAVSAADPREKRRAYSAASFALGVSFLFKGFVGPALFGAGIVTYLSLSRRFGELRHALGPSSAIAFLAPVALWIVPFVRSASPDLQWEFFVANHVGRFAWAYDSHSRPFYFYLVDLWQEWLPWSPLLPFALASFWRRRREPETQPAVFFFAMALGPFVFLSCSQAKDSIYLLPAYPAFALWLAWCCERFLRDASSRWASPAMAAVGAFSSLWALAALGATAYLHGPASTVAAAALVFGLATAWIAGQWRYWQPEGGRRVLLGTAALLALGWILWFTGPIATWETARFSYRAQVEAMLRAARGREFLLYQPNDGLRGGVSFFGNRTALEIDDPDALVRRLLASPDAVLLVREWDDGPVIPDDLARVARDFGVAFYAEARTPCSLSTKLILLRAERQGLVPAANG